MIALDQAPGMFDTHGNLIQNEGPCGNPPGWRSTLVAGVHRILRADRNVGLFEPTALEKLRWFMECRPELAFA